MSLFSRMALSALLDFAFRTAYRLGFPIVRMWWRLTCPEHDGTQVAVYVGPELLLVRVSYRAEWQLPGGSVQAGETPEAAARREMAEEIGVNAPSLLAVGSVCGIWDGRRDRVHFFELRLTELPKLHLDNREVIGTRLTPPTELDGMLLTRPVAAYLERTAIARSPPGAGGQHGL